jgi:hypothetical protein
MRSTIGCDKLFFGDCVYIRGITRCQRVETVAGGYASFVRVPGGTAIGRAKDWRRTLIQAFEMVMAGLVRVK